MQERRANIHEKQQVRARNEEAEEKRIMGEQLGRSGNKKTSRKSFGFLAMACKSTQTQTLLRKRAKTKGEEDDDPLP